MPLPPNDTRVTRPRGGRLDSATKGCALLPVWLLVLIRFVADLLTRTSFFDTVHIKSGEPLQHRGSHRNKEATHGYRTLDPFPRPAEVRAHAPPLRRTLPSLLRQRAGRSPSTLSATATTSSFEARCRASRLPTSPSRSRTASSRSRAVPRPRVSARTAATSCASAAQAPSAAPSACRRAWTWTTPRPRTSTVS